VPLPSLLVEGLRSGGIEKTLGRVRTEDRNTSRTSDIDLLLFNRETLQLGERRIPSPEILERPFIAIPLAEIVPDYVHPETGRTLSKIARSLNPRSAGMRRRADVVLLGSAYQPFLQERPPDPAAGPGGTSGSPPR
jgi:7,8-dihydro-6-hydroxymethylpterin-pyrophosphokinase